MHRLTHGSPLPRLSFPDPPPPEIYTLSLHDALPILDEKVSLARGWARARVRVGGRRRGSGGQPGNHDSSCSGGNDRRDRKSTRLNSSHVSISYAVFCLKKKSALDDDRVAERPVGS